MAKHETPSGAEVIQKSDAPKKPKSSSVPVLLDQLREACSDLGVTCPDAKR
ncbi:MAG: hypothetical protein K9M03_01600 [Kiritimatiellales bacterium]|nr:hypothetical protein [Kiritimatiellales bacterium]